MLQQFIRCRTNLLSSLIILGIEEMHFRYHGIGDHGARYVSHHIAINDDSREIQGATSIRNLFFIAFLILHCIMSLQSLILPLRPA